MASRTLAASQSYSAFVTFGGEAEAGRRTDSVVVFREQFLAASETFVRDHIDGLRRFDALPLGGREVPGGLQVAHRAPRFLEDQKLLPRAKYAAARRTGWSHSAIRGMQMAAILRKVEPALVHAHFGPDGAIAERATTRLGIPLVVTFHGWDIFTYESVMISRGGMAQDMIERWPHLRQGVDAFIAVSNAVKGLLLEAGVHEEKIHVIGCGVDTRRFVRAQSRPRGPVVFVGRLVEKKGCRDLITAMTLVEDPPPLRVLGDGPLRGELEEYAQRVGVTVSFEGVATSDEVRAAMRDARLIAMPSRTASDGDSEGLGVVALEAAALGRVVVGYQHAGLAEAVINGETGLLADEGDVAGLARLLRSAVAPGFDLDRMGAAAREHVTARYDQARQLDRLEDVYAKVAR